MIPCNVENLVMHLSHLNYIRLRDKHFLSAIRMEARISHRTIFMKEFSFARLAAARKDVSSRPGSKVSQTLKLQ
jgi:hypothetical protein